MTRKEAPVITRTDAVRPAVRAGYRWASALRVPSDLRLWWEAALVGAGYWLYTVIANAAPREAGAALAHGRALLAGEQHLHIAVELTLNRWWAASRDRIVVGNVYYDVMHFAVPAAVLFFLYLRRPDRYLLLRRTLLLASLVGLAVFWLWPDAPPRLLPHTGFIDTIAKVQTFGAGGKHGMTAAENPFAAMPSLHVTWAAWAVVGIWQITRRVWLRALVALHLAVTVFVIVATANHLFADVAGGVATLGLGLVLATLVGRLVPALPRRWPIPTISR